MKATKTETAPERKPFEVWTEAKKPAAWQANAARAMRGWAIGREVTEAEYDLSIDAAGKVVIGYDVKE